MKPATTPVSFEVFAAAIKKPKPSQSFVDTHAKPVRAIDEAFEKPPATPFPRTPGGGVQPTIARDHPVAVPNNRPLEVVGLNHNNEGRDHNNEVRRNNNERREIILHNTTSFVIEAVKILIVALFLVNFRLDHTWYLFGILMLVRTFFWVGERIAIGAAPPARGVRAAAAAQEHNDNEGQVEAEERSFVQRTMYRTWKCTTMYFVSFFPSFRIQGLEVALEADGMDLPPYIEG